MADKTDLEEETEVVEPKMNKDEVRILFVMEWMIVLCFLSL